MAINAHFLHQYCREMCLGRVCRAQKSAHLSFLLMTELQGDVVLEGLGSGIECKYVILSCALTAVNVVRQVTSTGLVTARAVTIFCGCFSGLVSLLNHSGQKYIAVTELAISVTSTGSVTARAVTIFGGRFDGLSDRKTITAT